MIIVVHFDSFKYVSVFKKTFPDKINRKGKQFMLNNL